MTFAPTRGFTLIELLVVISILALLASIIFSNVVIARTKSIDAAKVTQLASVRTALNAFYTDTGRMPNNYSCLGASCIVNNERAVLAMEDTESPDAPQTESGKAFRASMQELVTAGYLPQVPESPGGAGYVYYNYGPGSSAGAVIGTSLGAADPSDNGAPGSCRPFPSVSYHVPGGGGLAAPLDFQAGIDDRFDWERCLYLEDGFLVEGYCDSEGNPVGSNSPLPSANFCDTSVSTDYCLCNRY